MGVSIHLMAVLGNLGLWQQRCPSVAYNDAGVLLRRPDLRVDP